MATVLKFAQKFPAPIRMEDTLDAIIVLPKANFPVPTGGGAYGALTQLVVADMVTAMKTGLTAGKIVLFTNSLEPSAATTFADLVEPTGDWYTQIACVLGDVYEESDGSISIAGASKQFNYSGTDPAEDIVGWGYIDETA